MLQVLKMEKIIEIEEILVNSKNIEQMETNKNDEEIYTTKEKIMYILKGLSSILASIIHTFNNFSIWMLGYTTIYLISFRWHYNKNIDFSYSYCFIPLIHLSFGLSSSISGILEDKYGGRIAIILSNLILCISFSFMYYSKSIYIDFLLLLLIGFGIAIGYNITEKNACSFFMNKRALICGIINLIPNILCLILIFYNETYLINPECRPPLIDATYYKKKVFMNYQKLLISQIKISIFSCIGTLLFYFQNDPKETSKFGFVEKIDDNDNENNNGSENMNAKKKKIPKILQIKKALKDKRTIRLMIMIFLIFPTINLINNSMRMSKYLSFLFGIVYNIVGTISFLIFAFLGDCIQFRILYTILSALITASSFIYIRHLGEDEFITLVGIILVSFAFSGFIVIFNAHIMKVYGMQNYITIWGVIRGFGGISEVFAIIFNFTFETNSYIYKIIYATIGVFNFFSLCLGIFEKEDKFKY